MSLSKKCCGCGDLIYDEDDEVYCVVCGDVFCSYCCQHGGEITEDDEYTCAECCLKQEEKNTFEPKK